MKKPRGSTHERTAHVALVETKSDSSSQRKRIGTGMLGYAFMGKAHTNAFIQFPFIFPNSPIPSLSAIAGRSESAVKEAAKNFGYEKYYTDWHKVVKDDSVQVVDNGLPNNLHEDPCIEAAESEKSDLRKATRAQCKGIREDATGSKKGGN